MRVSRDARVVNGMRLSCRRQMWTLRVQNVTNVRTMRDAFADPPAPADGGSVGCQRRKQVTLLGHPAEDLVGGEAKE